MTTEKLKIEKKLLNEIKRLLRLSEIAQSKVKLNFNGTTAINPMQQVASDKLYRRAIKLKGGLSYSEFEKIHRVVIKEMENELINRNN
jgi:hypothetical protein